MRYFYQDKTYVPQFDEETQVVVEQAENHIAWSWNVITPEEIIYRENKHEDGTSSRFVDDVIPEVGEWVYNSKDSYPDTDKEFPPVIGSHDPFGEREIVSIVRDLTEEEIAERQREKEQREQEMREAQERAEQLDNYVKTEPDGVSLNTDIENKDNYIGPFVKVTGKVATCSTPTDDALPNEIVNVEYLTRKISSLEQMIKEISKGK